LQGPFVTMQMALVLMIFAKCVTFWSFKVSLYLGMLDYPGGRMRRIPMFILALLLSFCVSGYEKETKQEVFFAWMDGYVADEAKKENSISLILYFTKKNAPFTAGSVSSLELVGIENEVVITDFKVLNNANACSDDGEYSSYEIILTYQCLGQGIFETDRILLHFYDGSDVEYKIGNWIFDIGGKGTDLLDLQESPTNISDAARFDYIYSLSDANIKITKIWVGNQNPSADNAGIPTAGSIGLDSEAPVKFVKAKIELQKDGQTYIAYARGCYSGAYDYNEEAIQVFKEYATTNKTLQ